MARGMGGGHIGDGYPFTASFYSGAAIGHLVKRDAAGGNDAFVQCADGDVPFGEVVGLGPGADTVGTVLPWTEGLQRNLPYTGTAPAQDAGVVASATAGKVKAGTNAKTKTLEVDVPAAGFLQIQIV